MSDAVKVRDDAASEESGQGAPFGVSLAVFTALFVVFCAGLYVMSLYTLNPVWFPVGLGMSILALFVTFDIVPRFFTK